MDDERKHESMPSGTDGRYKGEGYFVSPHNFEGDSERAGTSFAIHDTTLRDGEQQAGILFTPEEKLLVAKALDGLGVDRIEAGMVAVSPSERDAIRNIAEANLAADIWTVVRSIPEEIDMALQCGVGGVGIILLCNEQYCNIFNWTVDEAISKALAAAERAKNSGLSSTLLIADAPRMTHKVLTTIVATAEASDLFDAVALMDTFGTLSPAGCSRLVTLVRDLTSLEVEIHAHNDFGLATANALAAVESGASVAHTSVLGLGERVGNTPLEEFAVSAKFLYGFHHGLKLEQLNSITGLVQKTTGVTVSANKPIVGASYSLIESGAVASEYTRLSNIDGYGVEWLYPFTPALIGRGEPDIVLGKTSGASNLSALLGPHGEKLSGSERRTLLAAAKNRITRNNPTISRSQLLDLLDAFELGLGAREAHRAEATATS